jgi:CRP-like cAMP-binding protein
MLNELFEILQKNNSDWEIIRNSFVERSIPQKTILLNEGEISTHLFFIKKGCLRMWLNKDGKDITLQFFFEDQAVASIDSLMSCHPSQFSIESIEPCIILSLKKSDMEKLFHLYPEIKDGFQDILFQRFKNYANLFLSRIRDTPQERYYDLIRNHPEIIKRVPQHYIASYLGITPVSLSRIRGRK